MTKKVKKQPLYITIYDYYKKLIMEGALKPGDKLSSIRKCAIEKQVSKTTVESGYMLLMAEGYIYSSGGSGFYVSEAALLNKDNINGDDADKDSKRYEIKYDFSTSSVDEKSFKSDLWIRYMKSALRNTDRMLAYGDTQGEIDLRIAIRNYVKEARGVVCSENQIVIGAGVQSLLNILCALIKEKNRICFTGNGFKQGKAVFDDHSYECYFTGEVAGSIDFYKKNKMEIIYVAPSYMTSWGKVMPMKTRNKLLDFANEENCLIIEDDFDSEFRYYMKPVPSLQSINGGKNVIYLGSFSKLLLPSVRIGFMVLPIELLDLYRQKGKLYNQTASTAEQIALCQFIRDGHLKKQIKRARKIYINKSQILCSTINKVFKGKAKAISTSAGFLIRMEVNTKKDVVSLIQAAEKAGIKLKAEDENNSFACLLLSCSSVNEEYFEDAMNNLKTIWEQEKCIN